MAKLYPFDLPEGLHPNAWWVLGFVSSGEQANALARHLSDDLGVRLDETVGERTISWAVGLSDNSPDRIKAQVGDHVDIMTWGAGAVRITNGALPPGVKLEKHTGKLVGTLTRPGLYSVTVTYGPAVKYDPLGSPGGPNDPGQWIPINQPREIAATALAEFPTTVEDLDDRDKDKLLAELLAWRDGQTIKEADNGN